ncbi:MAG: hypothetical protein ACLFQX_12365 [Candidatus Kapaibacterium sp.]
MNQIKCSGATKTNKNINLFSKVLFFAASFIFSFIFMPHSLRAQNDNVGIGTQTPDASALVEMVSTSSGLLIPRMTEAQRNAIASPATGLVIWQTSGNFGFYYYDGSRWIPLGLPGGPDGAVQFNYSNTFGGSAGLMWDRTNTRLGINTNTPDRTLDVDGSMQMSSSSGTSTFYVYEPDGGTNYTAFSATSMTANLPYLLPPEAGEKNSVLVNDGEGNLRWSPQKEFTANMRYNVTTIVNSASYNILDTDSHVLVTYDGDCSLYLPSGADLDGKAIFIKKLAPANQDQVTIYPDTGETIDGDTSYGPIRDQYEAVRLIYDGSDWYIMSWYRVN